MLRDNSSAVNFVFALAREALAAGLTCYRLFG
jgi:hypothetical protein